MWVQEMGVLAVRQILEFLIMFLAFGESLEKSLGMETMGDPTSYGWLDGIE